MSVFKYNHQYKRNVSIPRDGVSSGEKEGMKPEDKLRNEDVTDSSEIDGATFV